MSRVNIKSILENKNTKKIITLNTRGIKNNNIITYKDNDILVIIKIDKSIKMKRNNIEFEFIENENTNCIYNIYDKQLNLNIFTNKLIIEEKYLEIDYIIEEEKLNFKLFIE
ncbi:MAG: DUF1934 family protein [Bacilli bacterium]|nr:DUF1934 family protein [Bacilli bacterium]